MRTPDLETDPSGLVALISATAGAILTAVVAFGVDLTGEQITALLGIVSTAGALAVALTIRRKAWAPATVDRELEQAFDRGVDVGRNIGRNLERDDRL